MSKENKVMCKIGVAGGAGAGKTTFCRMFADMTPNTAMLGVDKIMYAAFRTFGNALEKAFNEPPRYDHEGDLYLDYLTTYEGRVSIALGIIKNQVEKQLDEKFVEFTDLGKKIILVDSSILPVFKTWQECNHKIIINAENELKVCRLVVREKSKGHRAEYWRNLVHSVIVNPNETPHSLYIENNWSLSDLKKIIQQFSQKVWHETSSE